MGKQVLERMQRAAEHAIRIVHLRAIDVPTGMCFTALSDALQERAADVCCRGVVPFILGGDVILHAGRTVHLKFLLEYGRAQVIVVEPGIGWIGIVAVAATTKGSESEFRHGIEIRTEGYQYAVRASRPPNVIL